MEYKVIWHEKVLRDLGTIDKKDASHIVDRVQTYPAQNPISLGAPLKGTLQGLFRYRFGAYRVIYAVDIAEKRLIILHIKHRKEAYR